MKRKSKLLMFIVVTILAFSCNDRRDSCIKDVMEEENCSYEDACKTCDEIFADESNYAR